MKSLAEFDARTRKRESTSPALASILLIADNWSDSDFRIRPDFLSPIEVFPWLKIQ
jgi:hypothetical protein